MAKYKLFFLLILALGCAKSPDTDINPSSFWLFATDSSHLSTATVDGAFVVVRTKREIELSTFDLKGVGLESSSETFSFSELTNGFEISNISNHLKFKKVHSGEHNIYYCLERREYLHSYPLKETTKKVTSEQIGTQLVEGGTYKYQNNFYLDFFSQNKALVFSESGSSKICRYMISTVGSAQILTIYGFENTHYQVTSILENEIKLQPVFAVDKAELSLIREGPQKPISKNLDVKGEWIGQTSDGLIPLPDSLVKKYSTEYHLKERLSIQKDTIVINEKLSSDTLLYRYSSIPNYIIVTNIREKAAVHAWETLTCSLDTLKLNRPYYSYTTKVVNKYDRKGGYNKVFTGMK